MILARTSFCLASALLCLPAFSQGSAPATTDTLLTAEAIMARVAANQDKADTERAHYLYVQHARVISRKGKTVMCEEVTDSRVTPTATHQEQTLLTLLGRVRNGHDYLTYTELPKDKSHEDKVVVLDTSHGGQKTAISDTDIDLVENMRKNMTNDKSKDGMTAGLFPLTTRQQQNMLFTMQGQEMKNGRDTFHITFRPKNKDDFGWKGDAWIDSADFQPVVVRTAMSRNIPFAVRTLLGTSLPGLGFTVVYAPQTGGKTADQSGGLWFPVSFGTEFKINVLFFFHREMVIAAENRNFERTHVTTTIHGVEPAANEN